MIYLQVNVNYLHTNDRLIFTVSTREGQKTIIEHKFLTATNLKLISPVEVDCVESR